MPVIDVPPPAFMQDPEIQAFSDSVARFFEREAPPERGARWRAAGQVEREFWRQAGDAGLLGVSVPTEYGGAAVVRIACRSEPAPGDGRGGSGNSGQPERRRASKARRVCGTTCGVREVTGAGVRARHRRFRASGCATFGQSSIGVVLRGDPSLGPGPGVFVLPAHSSTGHAVSECYRSLAELISKGEGEMAVILARRYASMVADWLPDDLPTYSA